MRIVDRHPDVAVESRDVLAQPVETDHEPAALLRRHNVVVGAHVLLRAEVPNPGVAVAVRRPLHVEARRLVAGARPGFIGDRLVVEKR